MSSGTRRYPGRKYGATVVALFATVLLVVFVAVVATSIERDALIATAILGFGSAIGAAIIGMCLAAAILGSEHWRRFFLVATAVGATLPLIWHLAAWDAAFGRLGWLGGTNRTLEAIVSGWAAAIWVHAVAAAPMFALLVVFFRLEAGRVHEEQALVDTGPWTVFWSISLPRLIPIILGGGLWLVVVASREIAVTDIYQIGTVAEQVYLGFALGQLDQMLAIWPTGREVISLRLYVLTASWLVVAAVVFLTRFSDRYGAEHATPNRFESGRLGRLSSWLGLGALALTFAVPIFNLIVRAGWRVELIGGEPTAIWSSQALIAAIVRAARECHVEFCWSSVIAISASSLMLGLALIWTAWAWQSKLGRVLLLGSIALAAGIPGPMAGALLWSGWGLIEHSWAYWLADRTIFLQVLANSAFCWPLAAGCVWIAAGSLSRELDDAARVQGISSWRRFWAINVLSKIRLWIGLWLLLWVVSFGELSAQQMVAAPGIDTIPRQLLGWLHAGVDELAAAASLLIGFLFAIVGGIGANFVFPPTPRARS